jgi:hypothetical protein
LPRGIVKHVHHDPCRLSQWKMAILGNRLREF